MQARINYLFLFIVITLGVISGNLVSNWITSKYTSKEVILQSPIEPEQATNTSLQTKVPEKQIEAEIKTGPRETIKLSPENSDKPTNAEIPVNSEELIEQRKLDDDGIRLAKQCSEWTVVHKDMQTKTSERGMNKYCDQYYDYISFGTLPDTN